MIPPGEHVYFGGQGGPRRKSEKASDCSASITDEPFSDASPSLSSAWETHRYQPASRAMGVQSDIHTPQHQYRHQYANDMDVTVTEYINADFLADTQKFSTNQKEIELRTLSTSIDGVAVEAMEQDTMTVATRSTVPVEWTSPDSSFGAAFPCCGFIPKKTRRNIELCLIAIGSFLFIYIIIKFSVIITSGLHKNGQSSTNTTSGGSKYLETDDDFYVIDNEADDNYFFWR